MDVRVLEHLSKNLNGPAVVMTKDQHQVVTNLLRKAIPYGGKLRTMTKPEIIEAYKEAYRHFPDLLEVALKILE